ncbi:MAG TPA: vgr related protein, partial [Sphingorhabdus sp.]|nr:vgr related protein [Sphingorhabdus sp.]
QQGIFLPLKRHPFCRYDYSLKPGWKLEQYGIEQQAEIVRHVFLLKNGAKVPGAPELQQYVGILPF